VAVKIVIVGIHEAKTHFSKLLKRVEDGEEVIIKSFDKPVAKLVPIAPATTSRKPGLLAGQITIGPGFDDLPAGFEVFAE
jgi:prevent-host-death family protein